MDVESQDAIRAIRCSLQHGKQFQYQLEAVDCEKKLLEDAMEAERTRFVKEYKALEEQVENERQMIRDMNLIQAAMEDEIKKLRAEKECVQGDVDALRRRVEVTSREAQRGDDVLAAQRKACERRAVRGDPQVICYYWALWSSVTRSGVYALRVKRNALNRYHHWKSGRILRMAYTQWKINVALACRREEFSSRLRRRDSFRALAHWKICSLKRRSSLRHFHIISQQFLNRAFQGWAHFLHHNREARAHHESRFNVSQRLIKKAFFLRWRCGIGTNAAIRNLACIRIFLAFRDKIRKRRAFREWGYFLHRRLEARTNVRLLNNFALCIAWRRLSTRLLFIEQRQNLVARFPLPTFWRLLRKILWVWRRTFIAEHDVRVYFSEWRVIHTQTRLENNKKLLSHMQKYLKQRDEDMKKYEAHFQGLLRQKEEALMERDQIRDHLREQVEDTKRKTNDSNQYQRRSIELTTENANLKSEVKKLKDQIHMMEEINQRFSRKCAACTKDSPCSGMHGAHQNRPLSAAAAARRRSTTPSKRRTTVTTTNGPGPGPGPHVAFPQRLIRTSRVHGTATVGTVTAVTRSDTVGIRRSTVTQLPNTMA